MLLSADVKGLEVVTAAYLSQDPILCQEVRDGVDFHEANKQRFNLPTRTVAKRFKFKLIYGATAFGYANDADFIEVSTNQDYWQKVINEYYDKYRGVKEWHTGLVKTAIAEGRYICPSGREYHYPSKDVVKREWFWRPKILNYPVQGLGATLVMLARISFWRRLTLNKPDGVKPCSTVHDSIVVDLKPELCYTIGSMLRKCVQDVPMNFERMFGREFNLPLDAEVKVGNDLKNMETIEC